VKSDQKEDLDNAILHFTHAIFVSPYRDGKSQNIVRVLFLLAEVLHVRIRRFKQPSDAKYCAEYFRYLQSQPLEISDVPRNQVKSSLVVALGSQVELGIGDMARDIDEMRFHCRELLASEIPQSRVIRPIRALISASHTKCEESLAREVLEEVIEYLREANSRLDSQELAYLLADILSDRYSASSLIDDYEEAMTLLDKIIPSEVDGDCSGPYMKQAIRTAASLAWDRVRIYDDPECLEEAIRRVRACLRISSTEDYNRHTIEEMLAMLLESRSSRFGITDGLQEARLRKAEITYVPSFSRLVTSLLARSPKDKTYWWTAQRERHEHLRALRYVCHSTDIAEIGEVIKYCQLLLDSTRPSDHFIYYPALGLGEVLFHAFKSTNEIEYLDKSVDVLRDILKMPTTEWARHPVIKQLLQVLAARLSLSGDRKDFDEAMELYSLASQDTYTPIAARSRFELSCEWANNARLNGHHTASTAYEIAISSMQDTLLFAPTLETQHVNLVALHDKYEELPLNIASYEIDRGRLKEAIQALEQGRALIWSELRGLRTSIDQLAVDPGLAKEFTAVNRELETLTISVSPSTVMNDDDGLEDGKGMDKFGRLVAQHQKLLARRNKLVSQIQALPGFENFLVTPSFDALRSAAERGPVIIVNHSKWRSDILVILHDDDPLLITTPDNFYDRAIELRDRLVRTRKNASLESRQYQRALRFVLESLYELVGEPVIKELRRLNIPELSRVWWCPTSVFCSLPLHAMGPIPSDDGIPRYFSDLYIPSYTPTLSALIESRKPGKMSLEKPSVLLVANPDESMEQAWPEIQSVQSLDTNVTTLLKEEAEPSAVLEGIQDHRFAHFVCHGNLVSERPFDAYFGLHESNRLTLLHIIRSRLPVAEFAFLSACHTAELTEGSIADEGLHLTAAVQYCGFRSVVGTMWAMADQDGSDLAECFYKSIFSSDKTGLPYYERSAKALRNAVRAVRKKKKLPLEQWVNFVHYGA
jgi:CHAT domain-containing protein